MAMQWTPDLSVGIKEIDDQHKELIADFTKFRTEFNEAGAKLSIVLGLNTKLVNWLKTHICGTDKQLGAFLKTKV